MKSKPRETQSAGAQVAQAHELIAKGDKKLKGGVFSGIFSSKAERAEQALECYKAAAIQFKLANAWEDAADAYLKCAQCEILCEGSSVGEHYVEASSMKKRTNKACEEAIQQKAITYLEKAVEFYCNENRISYAGKLQKQIAEIYEEEDQKDLAHAAYEKAVTIFELDNSSSSDYQNMRIKVADYLSQKTPDQLVKAIKIFEEVGKKYSENKLTQGIAGNIFFKRCEKSIENSFDICPPYTNTRQAKLIQQLIVDLSQFKEAQFSQDCYEYNQVIPFDRWQLKILNVAKSHIKKGFDPLLCVEHAEGDAGIL